MLPNYHFDTKSQTSTDNSFPEPEFLDSPFDRWLHLADVIIQKHSGNNQTGTPRKPQSAQNHESHIQN
jgi:hypothetical protein